MNTSWLEDLIDFIKSLWPCHRVFTGSRAVVYRFGRAVDEVEPGIICRPLWFWQVVAEPIVARVIDLPMQGLMTRDDVAVSIDFAIRFEIADLIAKQTEVVDFNHSLQTDAMSFLSVVVAGTDYAELHENSAELRDTMLDALSPLAEEYGVTLLDVGMTVFVRSEQKHIYIDSSSGTSGGGILVGD
jgi:regulator of protease activity HflC (stomatin/prohibitin superfamily)